MAVLSRAVRSQRWSCADVPSLALRGAGRWLSLLASCFALHPSPVPLLWGRWDLEQPLTEQDLGGKAVAAAISHCSVLMWRWTILHTVCLKGTASVSLQIRGKKKNLSFFFIKKDVTSSNKCLCELLKATLFIGDDFSSSCIHKILA